MQTPTRSRSHVPATLLCILMVAVAVPARPHEGEHFWPQWRGPHADGVAPGADPPVEWSETTHVRWKVEIPGRGAASPIVWEDRVFVLSAVPVAGEGTPNPAQRRRRRGGIAPAPQEFTVYAIARESGGVVWQRIADREAPHEGRQANNTFASASAVTDGEVLLAHFGSRGLYCYDFDGELQWQRDLGDMRTRLGFGEGSSPALHGDAVIITWDHEGQSFIVALDRRTGAELWRQNRDEPTTWATPLVVEYGGRTQVITGGTNRVRSYDLDSGEIIWQGKGLTPNAIPSPVYGDGVAYLTSGYRGSALQAIDLARASGDVDASGALLWEHNRDTPYVPSPLLYDGTLYYLKSNSGILSAVDVDTGRHRYGPARLPGIAEVYASPVAAAGRIYIVGRDGNALVISDSSELEILAQNSLDDGFDASPAIVGDEIYLRGYRHLYRISED